MTAFTDVASISGPDALDLNFVHFAKSGLLSTIEQASPTASKRGDPMFQDVRDLQTDQDNSKNSKSIHTKALKKTSR